MAEPEPEQPPILEEEVPTLPPVEPSPGPPEQLRDLMNDYRSDPNDFVQRMGIRCKQTGPDGVEVEVVPIIPGGPQPPLELIDSLNNAAQHLADYNASAGVTGHEDPEFMNDPDCDFITNPRGCNAHIKRAKEFGYDSTYVVENVMTMSPDQGLEDAMKAWICSGFHNDNLLNESLTDVGFGYNNGSVVMVAGKCTKRECVLNPATERASCRCIKFDDPEKVPEREPNNTSNEEELVRLINEFRRENMPGVEAVALNSDPSLKDASDHLARNNWLSGNTSHDDPKFSGENSYIERVKDFGYNFPTGSNDIMQLVGEQDPNVGSVGGGGADIFESWVSDPEVRDRLLYPLLDDISVSWVGDQVVLIGANNPSTTNQDFIDSMRNEYLSDPVGFCSRYACGTPEGTNEAQIGTPVTCKQPYYMSGVQ